MLIIKWWNTVYLTEAIKALKEKGLQHEELIQHISPLAWEHINFLEEYKFNLKQPTNLWSLR